MHSLLACVGLCRALRCFCSIVISFSSFWGATFFFVLTFGWVTPRWCRSGVGALAVPLQCIVSGHKSYPHGHKSYPQRIGLITRHQKPANAADLQGTSDGSVPPHCVNHHRLATNHVQPTDILCSFRSSCRASAHPLPCVFAALCLFQGYSTEVELPEKVDLLVGEIIGSVATEESVYSTIRDAQARFMKDPYNAASYIPQRVQTLIAPVSWPFHYMVAAEGVWRVKGSCRRGLGMVDAPSRKHHLCPSGTMAQTPSTCAMLWLCNG